MCCLLLLLPCKVRERVVARLAGGWQQQQLPVAAAERPTLMGV